MAVAGPSGHSRPSLTGCPGRPRSAGAGAPRPGACRRPSCSRRRSRGRGSALSSPRRCGASDSWRAPASARWPPAPRAVRFALTGPARAAARVGEPAPTFTALATTGSAVSLEAHGGKVVVLEWTNHDCPYVRKHYESGNMQALQKETTGQGVVWLTIISSAPGEQGHVNAGEANALTRKRGAAPTAVLLDPQGTVGKMYGATNTPHMYVIDSGGKLVYAGAIYDRPTVPQGRHRRRQQLRARGAPGGRGRPAGQDARDPGLRLHRQVLVARTEDDMTSRASFLMVASVALSCAASVGEAQQPRWSSSSPASARQRRRPRRARRRRPALPGAGAAAGAGNRRGTPISAPRQPAAGPPSTPATGSGGAVAQRQGRGGRPERRRPAQRGNKLSKQTALSEKGDMVNGRGDTPNRHDILTGEAGRPRVSGRRRATCRNWTSSTRGRGDGRPSRPQGRATRAAKSWNAAHPSRGSTEDAAKRTSAAPAAPGCSTASRATSHAVTPGAGRHPGRSPRAPSRVSSKTREMTTIGGLGGIGPHATPLFLREDARRPTG